MFWQKDIEMISRRALEELQIKRLKQTVRQAYKNIPFYKEHFSKLHIQPKDVISLKDIRKEFTMRTEKKMMKQALERTSWNRKKAAILLDISYKSLLNKIKAYNLA